jgi:hypothetical protein
MSQKAWRLSAVLNIIHLITECMYIWNTDRCPSDQKFPRNICKHLHEFRLFQTQLGHFSPYISLSKILFIQCLICLSSGPVTLPKRYLQMERSSSSFYKFHYLLFLLRLSSSCLCLLLVLPNLHIFPLITCFRMYLLYMRPVQLAFLLLHPGYSCLSWLCILILNF